MCMTQGQSVRLALKLVLLDIKGNTAIKQNSHQPVKYSHIYVMYVFFMYVCFTCVSVCVCIHTKKKISH